MNLNPRGLGGFQFRPQDRYPIGKPGFCCDAPTRQGDGAPCRRAPCKGKKRCYLHGGWSGRGKHRLPGNERELSNKGVRLARAYSDKELERRSLAGELHPELRQAFRDTDRSRLHPADKSRLMLAIDNSLHGRLTAAAWRDTRKALGLDPPRAAPAPVVTNPLPEERPTFVELWGRGSRPPNGW